MLRMTLIIIALWMLTQMTQVYIAMDTVLANNGSSLKRLRVMNKFEMFTSVGDAAVAEVVRQFIVLLDQKSPQSASLYLRNALAQIETTHPEVGDTAVRDCIMQYIEPELQRRRIEYDWEFVYWGLLAGLLKPVDREEVWEAVQDEITKAINRLEDL